MIELPDRIEELIARIERGEPVTQADVNRQSTLIALDMAQIGRKFAIDMLKREEQYLAALEKETVP